MLELDEIGYQLKELNKNVKELNEHCSMFGEFGELYEIRVAINKLLDIQKEYMNMQKKMLDL